MVVLHRASGWLNCVNSAELEMKKIAIFLTIVFLGCRTPQSDLEEKPPSRLHVDYVQDENDSRDWGWEILIYPN